MVRDLGLETAEVLRVSEAHCPVVDPRIPRTWLRDAPCKTCTPPAVRQRLQEAQIPLVLINALEAVPRTPLYNRLKEEGRLLNGHPDADDASRYQTGVGRTNFRLRHMTGAS